MSAGGARPGYGVQPAAARRPPNSSMLEAAPRIVSRSSAALGDSRQASADGSAEGLYGIGAGISVAQGRGFWVNSLKSGGPAEAAGLLDRDDRSLLVLSYPWQTAGHPDPNGTTLAAVRRYLRSEPTNACALFLDYVRRAASIRCPLGRACGCCSARALLPDGPWIDTVYGSSPSSKKAPTADGCCQRRCARSHRRGGAAYELMHAHISRPPTVDVPSPAVRALRRLSSAR